MPQSALIMEVPWAEPVVGPWRRAHDAISHRGVPAHITILYPFRAPDVLDDTVNATLASLAASVPAWDLSLVEVDAFPDAVWLRPEPDDHLHAPADSVWAAFPACPPHGGQFPALRPHVTVGQDPDPERIDLLRRRAAEELATMLPVTGRVDGLSLFVSGEAGEWTRCTVFPFASGA
ncbi:MAG TPA: 2'-5' RNA ligase family protein [Microthrixaceae bacterium]|nr:2'-5' RNA ligase family protein [Microthrixaceae bacterium]